ncbi:hypothetical protein [Litoreibacter roseus]|uniref:Uncharacterized protein n=1 Tax=Litoreibacter roseus TaxID=2601869 RepID=A0A6N6JI17_9RHOB|nr:hypothetical protein [Litoreibacter roseus]GFE65049.1 hypothetical protein KIN_21230 [Litoreibacter roseus]
MTDESAEKSGTDTPIDLGVYNRQDRGLMAADLIALVLTGFWLFAVGLYFLVLSPSPSSTGQSGIVVTMVAIFLPIALIWIGATVAKTARIMREEAARLQAAIDAMRKAYISQTHTAGMGVKPAVEQKLDQIAASQKRTASAIATFASTRDNGRLPGQPAPAIRKSEEQKTDSQPALALEDPYHDTMPPLTVDEFIGALDFPEDENDAEGFRKLRRALADRESSKLIRASQDILTLMSQDGIYMDDLIPDRARPEVWRSFAKGERGRPVATLGGIHDRSSLALASGRMRSDPVFRDTAHHFLRQFDKTFAAFEEVASDEDITRLSDTRTSRAFMILGRVTGTFD